jgi:spermidine/putrescine transport system substrate-binding protein
MLDSQRDTIGVALRALGFSLNTTNPAEIEAAGDLLLEQKPLVMGYIGDATENLMAAGEATMAVLWSGDALNAIRKNPNMTYIIPREGANLWEDNFIIPQDSKKKELAEAFINYMYRPEVGYESWEYIGYSTPNQGTFELLPLEEQQDLRWYPEIEDPRFEMNRDLDEETLQIYHQVWLKIKS